jgi:hypothetical protein
MRFDKLTLKAQEALQGAQELMKTRKTNTMPFSNTAMT